ncbi:MAG TPA: gfo/Idh/MocA family oxidoreductase, partial [Chloroflexota bacterium]|nr:gfo/Idh/MocA family oxidoreductase [Chloroflexota bacterium]
LHALQTGPYGRCVYRMDNDVVDHQVVTMEHANGAVSALVMHGHSDREERTMRYDGTRATLRGRFRTSGEAELTVHDHVTGAVEHVPVGGADEYGHGGGDQRLVRAFAGAVRAGETSLQTSARLSLESHLLAFAAEESRLGGRPIEVADYRSELERAPNALSGR